MHGVRSPAFLKRKIIVFHVHFPLAFEKKYNKNHACFTNFAVNRVKILQWIEIYYVFYQLYLPSLNCNKHYQCSMFLLGLQDFQSPRLSMA